MKEEIVIIPGLEYFMKFVIDRGMDRNGRRFVKFMFPVKEAERIDMEVLKRDYPDFVLEVIKPEIDGHRVSMPDNEYCLTIYK